MFLKSNASRPQQMPPAPARASITRRRETRSLRFHLILWQGTFVVLALSALVSVVLVQITPVVNQSIEQALHTESDVAARDLEKNLLPTSPYWPAHLSLDTINTHHDPTLAVQVVDIQGSLRYHSFAPTTIPLEKTILQAVRSGQVQEYSRIIESISVQVQALPIRVPVKAVDKAKNGNAVIGILFVAKVRKDSDSILLSLWQPFLLSALLIGVVMLLGSWATASYVLRPITMTVNRFQTTLANKVRGTVDSSSKQRMQRSNERNEIAQVETIFNELLATLDSTMRVQQHFVANASHELRTPLTTIQGNIALLQQHINDIPPEERRVMLADVYGEILRLVRLVDELLLLAHVDAKSEQVLRSQQTPQTSKVEDKQQIPLIELDSLLFQLVRSYRQQLSDEGAELELEIISVAPVRMYGDEDQIRRILQILLDNALAYTPMKSEKKGVGRVLFSLEQVGQEAKLQVRDNGIGIDAIDLPHIFERFYRADHARLHQGTGLGLSIAQTLAEQINGRITVESTPSRGSTFSFWLPIA